MSRARVAIAAVFAFGFSWLALPALAQKAPAQIALAESPAGAPHTVLGTVNAEYHQKTILSKISSRDAVNSQLRDAAAKLGADAVVDIKYENNNPIMSKKGFKATGTAVRFVAQSVAPPPVLVAVAPPAPAAVAPPVLVAPVASAPVAAPPVVVAVAPPAPAPVGAMVILSEGELNTGRTYSVLGAVVSSGTVRASLDEDLRAKARALGADAVIMLRYGSEGAQGVAVKYR